MGSKLDELHARSGQLICEVALCQEEIARLENRIDELKACQSELADLENCLNIKLGELCTLETALEENRNVTAWVENEGEEV